MLKRIFILVIICCIPLSLMASEGADVANAPAEICPILIGSELPAITVKNLSGQSVDLNKVVAAKPTVLIYFRGGW